MVSAAGPPLTLSQVKERLQAMGAEVKETEWRLEHCIIPQLQIVAPVVFLATLDNNEWVVEEAEESSLHAPATVRSRLSRCNARLEFGGANNDAVMTDQGMFVAAWTGLDPAEPHVRILLEGLARGVDGLFEDNVNGTWWTSN